jgi:GTP-binding protein
VKNNIYQQAEFLCSAYQAAQFPPDRGREVAFAGRSNSGKSSVINAITGRKTLARVSNTPGRTQMINFFSLGDNLRLVDLPGYGYAKVSADLRRHWAQLTRDYFTGRLSLQGLVLVTDIRRQLTEHDKQMLAWSLARGVPVHILLNKVDKISRGAARQAYAGILHGHVRSAASIQIFSAIKKSGVPELMSLLDTWMKKKKGPGLLRGGRATGA